MRTVNLYYRFVLYICGTSAGISGVGVSPGSAGVGRGLAGVGVISGVGAGDGRRGGATFGTETGDGLRGASGMTGLSGSAFKRVDVFCTTNAFLEQTTNAEALDARNRAVDTNFMF